MGRPFTVPIHWTGEHPGPGYQFEGVVECAMPLDHVEPQYSIWFSDIHCEVTKWRWLDMDGTNHSDWATELPEPGVVLGLYVGVLAALIWRRLR